MFRLYRELEQGEFIVVGVDTATGLGDYVTAQYLSKTKKDVPLVYRSKDTMTAFTLPLADSLEKIFEQTGVQPTVAIERNNGGVFELDRLAAINRLSKYTIYQMPEFGTTENEATNKLGWNTNTATRPQMLQDLKNAIDNRLIRVYDPQTISQLLSFVIVTTTSSVKAQAEKGAHDDDVMALAIAWQLYQQCTPPLTDLNAKNDFSKYRIG